MAAVRLIAKVPTLAAFSYRHNMGLPYVYPDNDLNFAENFLSMMFKKTEAKHVPKPALSKALDVLFILHADHEQNCSTNAVRGVGSSDVDPYSAVAAGVAALYGPLHGGANEAVLRMLRRIGSVDNIPGFLERVKNREEKLMGFGHRVYKNYDPRARIIQQHMDEVFEATEYNAIVEIARELEKRALDDEYFTSRKLYPNVDYYSGIIYEALEIPAEMFTVIFAIPRTAGWVAQWMEMKDDSEQKIARPRQIYTGHRERDYVAVDDRDGPEKIVRRAGRNGRGAARSFDGGVRCLSWKLTVRHGSDVEHESFDELGEPWPRCGSGRWPFAPRDRRSRSPRCGTSGRAAGSRSAAADGKGLLASRSRASTCAGRTFMPYRGG